LRFAPGGDGIGEAFDSFTAKAILPLIRRPSRYIDGELNVSNDGFRAGFFNVLLVFPDVYEIGMSHQGIRFLYHRLAGMEGVGVELAFAPWPDAERLMRAVGEPLRSLQTGTPVGRFDLVGLSVTYELHYTNMLMVLDLAGLSLEAADRREDDPIVVAGGPCCTNPLPFVQALDAVFLGDGEESLAEAVEALARLKRTRSPRAAMKEALARIEGVYAEGKTSSVRARTHRFQPGDLPRLPIVPSSEVVHQRLAIEIMRGCARGCRFCHAGMFYRPCRERSVDEIVEAALAGLEGTGWDEVSLLSLSTSDYSRLEELLARLTPELERRKVSLALPSLRPETITKEIVAASSIVTKSGFTLAPEAGTQRLRRVIKKDFSDDEILQGVMKILGGGWQTLKLYFMIGLPTETNEDLAGIADLIGRVLGLPRRRGRFNLSVSISPFVPKPHTPFQWERQCSIEEFRAKQDFLSKRIRNRFVTLSQREPAVSVLEGILARGDSRLWPALRRAYELGCRFDGWMDEFRFDLWERSLAECGLPVEALIAARPLEEPLPWDSFELHGTKNFLRRERESAYSAPRQMVAPYEPGIERLVPAIVAPRAVRTEQLMSALAAPPEPGASSSARSVFRYRFRYEKTGRERFLSHIETMNVIQRALRRSKLPLNFTEGFHQHPRISAGPSLAVGMEGVREFFDVEFLETGEPPSGRPEIAAPSMTAPAPAAPSRTFPEIGVPSPEILNPFLPAGIRIKACAGPFTRKAGKLPQEARFTYLLLFDALREILKSTGASIEGLSENERMWYLLGKELGLPEAFDAFECGVPVDPVGWLEAEWGRMFEQGASLKDAKGRERSCAGCSVRVIESAAEAESALNAGDRGGIASTLQGGRALELVLPGAEGAPRPHDVLKMFLPNNLAALVRIRRMEILYKHEGGFVDPLKLIESRRPET
jgi:radical SAM superfamily enzyme YgiQ (UPF0313 family)